jgi:hypothetical protein
LHWENNKCVLKKQLILGQTCIEKFYSQHWTSSSCFLLLPFPLLCLRFDYHLDCSIKHSFHVLQSSKIFDFNKCIRKTAPRIKLKYFTGWKKIVQNTIREWTRGINLLSFWAALNITRGANVLAKFFPLQGEVERKAQNYEIRKDISTSIKDEI